MQGNSRDIPPCLAERGPASKKGFHEATSLVGPYLKLLRWGSAITLKLERQAYHPRP